MIGYSLKIASLSMTACLCVFGFNSGAAAQRGGVRKPKKKPQTQEQPKPQLPAYTPAPLQPLPLEQVPAVAPKVNFYEGELTMKTHGVGTHTSQATNKLLNRTNELLADAAERASVAATQLLPCS